MSTDRLIDTTPLGLRATLRKMVEIYRAFGDQWPGVRSGWMLPTLHVTEVEALIAQLSDEPRCERKASGRWWICHYCSSSWQVDCQLSRDNPGWRPQDCPEHKPTEEKTDG